MKTKRLVSTLLAVTLILSVCIVPAFASSKPSFHDVPDTHWAYDSITVLSEQNIIGGKGNGRFDPQGTVTSAEFLKMLLCVTSGTTDFSEYDFFPGHWWSPYLGAALEYGIITSREVFNEDVSSLSDISNIYGPLATRVMDTPASRREMAKYTMRAMKAFNLVIEEVDITGISGVMPDYNLVSDDVCEAYALGIITGQAGGYFNGNKTATRAEAATIVHRVMDPAKRKIPDVSKPFVKWSYEDENGVLHIYENQTCERRLAKEGDIVIKADGTSVVLKRGPNGIIGEGQGVAPDNGAILLNLFDEDPRSECVYVKVGETNWFPAKGYSDSLGNSLHAQEYRINRTTGEGHFIKEWQHLTDKIARPASRGTKGGQISKDSYSLYRWSDIIYFWVYNF